MGYGTGQGLLEGVKIAGSYIMPALQMRQQQKRYDQQDKQFNRRIEILRGQAGLPPSYHELEPQEGAVPDTNSLAPNEPLASPDLPMSTMPSAPVSASPISPAAALGRMPGRSMPRMGMGSPFNMNPRFRRPGLP